MQRKKDLEYCSDCDGSNRFLIRGEPLHHYDGGTDVMMVGEAPGIVESEQLRPFVGKAGKRLRSFLYKSKLDRYNVFLTNIVKCDISINIPPQWAWTKNCQHYLLDEIKEHDPKIIVGLGVTALKRIRGSRKGGMRNNHGVLYDLNIGGWDGAFLVTYHPSPYNVRHDAEIISDLEKVVEWLKMREAREERFEW